MKSINNRTRVEIICQSNILKDIKNNKKVPWKVKKMKSLRLSESLNRIGKYKKADRVKSCADQLVFTRDENDKLKLYQSWFCKARLCAMCAWRRTLKIFSQVSKIMNHEDVQKLNYKFIFLTLTVRNCKGEDLDETISRMSKAFDKLYRRTKIKKSIKGWFRSLEVTHNLDKQSDNYDTYHPHYHVIMAIKSTYFKNSEYYINHEEWAKFWQESLKIDYNPIVGVGVCKYKDKTTMEHVIAEMSKYTVKDTDYIIHDDESMTDKTVAVLDRALFRRRLTAFGGLFKTIHKRLNLSDAEGNDVDLVHIDDEVNGILAGTIEAYKWNIGYSEYLRSGGSKKIPKD